MKTDNDLLPCPFCGCVARYKRIDDPDDKHTGCEYIECTKCGASSNLTIALMDDVTEIVIEKWNNRV